MPDERTLAKEMAVLREELVTQPRFQSLASVIRLVEQFVELVGAPRVAEGIGEQVVQTIGRRRLASDRRNADDAIFVS